MKRLEEINYIIDATIHTPALRARLKALIIGAIYSNTPDCETGQEGAYIAPDSLPATGQKIGNSD